jgi:hypothetical protein
MRSTSLSEIPAGEGGAVFFKVSYPFAKLLSHSQERTMKLYRKDYRALETYSRKERKVTGT